MVALLGLILDQRLGVYVLANLDHGGLRLRQSSTHAGTLEHCEYDTFRLHWDNAGKERIS